MASQSGNSDAESSGQGISSELRAKDLPSKRLLGKGLASIVYETELNGERFARKDFIGVPSGTFQKVAAILVGLKDHKNVVKTHGRTVDKMSCSLVLEYMEEDLLDLLQKRKESHGRPAGTASGNQSEGNHSYPFELAEALDIISQIGKGMEFLHEQNIPHGDLKTKNILVTHINGDKNPLSVKVADFGLVRIKSKSMSFVSRQARKLDVVQWKSPEMLESLLLEENDETSSESDSNSDKECTGFPGVTDRLGADVYSFAVICSQILTGEDPYLNRNWKELGAKIVSGELRPNLPTACPSLLKDLLVACWGKVPAQRPTFSNICTILEHLHNLQTTQVPRAQQQTLLYGKEILNTSSLNPSGVGVRMPVSTSPASSPASAAPADLGFKPDEALINTLIYHKHLQGDPNIMRQLPEYVQPIYAKELKDIPMWLRSLHTSGHRTFPTQHPTYQLEVKMCCSKCEDKLIDELRSVTGVIDVKADKLTSRVVVSTLPSRLDTWELLRKARKIHKNAKFVDLSVGTQGSESISTPVSIQDKGGRNLRASLASKSMMAGWGGGE